MAKDKSDWDLTAAEDKDRIGGGPGAGDSNSGGGNASGVPDADTGMSAGDVVDRGDIDEDRAKLFPETRSDAARPGEDVEIGEEDVDHDE